MSRTDLRGTIKIARQEEVEILSCEELTAEEISDSLLHQLPTEIGAVPQLRQLRSSHHEIARLLAMGLKATEVSRRTGYSNSRISILKNDPAFKELLEFYSHEQEVVAGDMVKRLSTLTTDAIDLIQERLDEVPESFTNNQLTELIKTGADRSEAPPVTKSINLNQNQTLDVTVIKQIKEELSNGERGNVKYIERSTEKISTKTETLQGSRPEVCLPLQEPSTSHSLEEESERICRERLGVRAEDGEKTQKTDRTGRIVWNPDKR